MMRMRLNPGSSNIQLRPGAHEKESRMDFVRPYRELRKVPWLRMPRRIRRTALREFGKLAPYLRYKGCLLLAEQVAVTNGVRLFTKNTGPC